MKIIQLRNTSDFELDNNLLNLKKRFELENKEANMDVLEIFANSLIKGE
ncbi:hypothetical protein [Mycoplasma seminis]|uniref:Uncharacterized protein n=1 Tax=Mycoplasma seminis TaxID=512749 RepID=A0ABY9H9M2_9MOLU|nr:hypothetical protein [Mycoplasma seminis]WLP85284.1 hypothetical protein Q8852_03095 [Mycoplasma seminis]